jgi:hypothetical protein
MFVFIITSYINLSSGTIYSPSERLIQTHSSISSIKDHHPDAYIILVEYSKLTTEQKNSLLVNQIIDLSENTLAQTICKDKSLGDVYALVQGLVHVPKEFTVVCKLSGRYRLNDEYYPDCFTKDLFVIREIKHDFDNYKTVCYETKLIGIGQERVNEFILILNDCFQALMRKEYPNIEHALYKLLPISQTLVLKDKIGVEGNIAPTGEFQQV